MAGKSFQINRSPVLVILLSTVCSLSVTTHAAPVYTTAVYDAQDREIGTMQIAKYTPYKIEWLGGVEIVGEFEQIADIDIEYSLHFVQSLVVDEDSTPTEYADGTPLEVPFVDPPPGGYLGRAFDYLPYYDEGEFPTFYGMPSNSILDAQSQPDKTLQLSFETWLVATSNESPGQRPDRASDDQYSIAPLQGWKWGYSITYADDGNGTSNLGDFTVAVETFAWVDTPSPDWLAALGRSYGQAGSEEDWFDIEIVDCDNCVPEPATLSLFVFGTLILRRHRAGGIRRNR